MADPLLALFDTDPDEAKRKLTELSRRLVFFFQHHSASDPNDLAQEVFVRVLRKLPPTAVTYLDVVKFSFGVARKVLLEQHKIRPMEELPTEERLNDRRSSGTSPDQMVLKKERQDLIRQCLNELSEEERSLVYLWYWEEKAARKKFAADLGIDEDNLRLRKFRALNSFKRCITKSLE